MAQVFYCCHIVADQQVGDAPLLLDILQQVEDLRADGDIERGNRSSKAINAGSSVRAWAMPIRCTGLLLCIRPDRLSRCDECYS
jgi:hypothetical protein